MLLVVAREVIGPADSAPKPVVVLERWRVSELSPDPEEETHALRWSDCAGWPQAGSRAGNVEPVPGIRFNSRKARHWKRTMIM
jgi:hypothetical protein